MLWITSVQKYSCSSTNTPLASTNPCPIAAQGTFLHSSKSSHFEYVLPPPRSELGCGISNVISRTLLSYAKKSACECAWEGCQSHTVQSRLRTVEKDHRWFSWCEQVSTLPVPQVTGLRVMQLRVLSKSWIEIWQCQGPPGGAMMTHKKSVIPMPSRISYNLACG
jgi:hypothetical protein